MEIIRFALLGLATGAIYALLAQGLVLVYRGSGLLNFGQGAMAMFGAYAYYDLTVREHVSRGFAAILAVALSAAVGALFQLLVLRRMRNHSALSRVIATLALVLVMQSGAYLIFGYQAFSVPSLVPTKLIHVFSSQLPLTADRVYILGIGLTVGTALYIVYRWTPFGRITTAVAENELAAASFGYSADAVAAINWAIGSGLAGLAGVLIAPIILLQPATLVLLVIPAMAAALVGGFSSFPLTFVAALALGVAQSEIDRYVSQPGWATAAPFIVVIGLLTLRGRDLPLRGFILDRMPAVGSGRVRPTVVLALWGIGAAVAFGAGPDWDEAMVTTFGMAIVCLSIVVLTGYAGQLSLAQFVIAGVGAFLAAKLVGHMPLIAAVILASLTTGAIGAAVGLPALRTRGATLAVATLGLGSAIIAVVFDNPAWTGGQTGILLPSLSIFGWSIDPILHPDRYAFVTITVMLGIGVAVANLRRGMTGRRLLAVRSNERAAASLGVSVAGVKVYAFFMSAVIAAVGGILLAFVQPSVQASNFDVFTCILLVGVTVVGGIGFVPGAVMGSLLITGGLFSQALSGWSSFNDILPLIGAGMLTLTLIAMPDGQFEFNRRQLQPIIEKMDKLNRFRPKHHPPVISEEIVRVAGRMLAIDQVSVSFGGARVLHDVSLEVRAGEIHGLIGPNGAGKTTLIDAVTGFAQTGGGVVRFGDVDITGWSPRRRALHGLARSFQSLELFDDLTIEENLAVASQRHGGWRYLTDLVAPTRIQLGSAGTAAVRSFQLDDILSVQPSAVSFGHRKIVAIARSVASAPAILLLDEPAAGLDDIEAGELAALIRRLADEWGIGVLLVEHKVDMIMSISDRITVLNEGRVLASGAPDEIQSNPRVVDAYLGTVEHETSIQT